MSLSIFLFLNELVTCPHILVPTRSVEHWEKNHFPQGGMLKFTYKGHFLTIKKDILKILGLKIQMLKTCSNTSSTHINFYFWKKFKISIFGGISKFCLWADLSKFWQFWADFVALAMVDNMAEVWLKSSKPHNFWTMSPNVTCSISLEIYSSISTTTKVSKFPKIECIHSGLPRNAKSHFGYLVPLGANTKKLFNI